jgi:hypothetical protein
MPEKVLTWTLYSLKLIGSVGIVFALRPADAKSLVTQMRSSAAEFRFQYGYEVPVDFLAQTYVTHSPVKPICRVSINTRDLLKSIPFSRG